jgi:hypothetical protein
VYASGRMSEQLVDKIIEILGPFMGENMARASLRVYVNEIKINQGSFEPQHLDMLVLRLRTGLTAFAGKEKASQLINQILRLKQTGGT